MPQYIVTLRETIYHDIKVNTWDPVEAMRAAKTKLAAGDFTGTYTADSDVDVELIKEVKPLSDKDEPRKGCVT